MSVHKSCSLVSRADAKQTGRVPAICSVLCIVWCVCGAMVRNGTLALTVNNIKQETRVSTVSNYTLFTSKHLYAKLPH